MPWTAPECRRAGTVHLGGTLAEFAASERGAGAPERPFVLMAQPTLTDPGRAPEGKHVAWAYCHVPAGSELDMTERIEAQVERFAPGFRDLVLARSAMAPADFERYNPNYVGGDINGGRSRTSASSSPGRWRGRSLTRPPYRASTSARRPRRRAAGCTACAAGTPPGPR